MARENAANGKRPRGFESKRSGGGGGGDGDAPKAKSLVEEHAVLATSVAEIKEKNEANMQKQAEREARHRA